MSVSEVDAAATFVAHRDSLCRYLVRLTGDEDTAADIAQEAFVRFLERPPRGDRARAWLFTVATNLVRDAARSQTRRRVLLGGEGAAWQRAHGDPSRDPAEIVEGMERRHAVQTALASLARKERVALLMREEGFKQREIAEALGTTTASVGTLIARAAHKLAKQLNLDHESEPQ